MRHPLASVRRQLAGQPVLVFGSAPDPVLPVADIVARSRLICANGAGGRAAELGLPMPDVTVLTGTVLTEREPVNRAAMAALAGLSTTHLVVVDNRFEAGEIHRKMQAIAFSYEELHTVSRALRAYVVSVATRSLSYYWRGRKNRSKISTGLFACALALYARASCCAVSGISFSRQGHSYGDGEAPRQHVSGDQWFVERARAAGHDLELLGAE